MEIKGPGGNLPMEFNSATARLISQDWQIGQLLNAIVVKSQHDRVLLNISGTLVDGKTPIPLQQGQRLTLQILSNTPTLDLKIIDLTQDTQQDILTRALRVLMPKQTPMTPLLANLQLLNHPPSAIKNLLPKKVIELSQILYRLLPTQNQIVKPAGLEQAIGQSGLFLENSLSRLNQGEQGSQKVIQADLRTQLLRLAAMLKATALAPLDSPRSDQSTKSPITSQPPTATISEQKPTLQPANRTMQLPNFNTSIQRQNESPQLSQAQTKIDPTFTTQPSPIKTSTRKQQFSPQFPQAQGKTHPSLSQMTQPREAVGELLRQVEGVLARLQVQQLHATSNEEHAQPSWVVELPVRTDQGTDVFHMRIQRDDEQKHKRTKQSPWTITLAFDLDRLGPVHVQVTLLNQQISVIFWAEHIATQEVFKQHLNTLHKHLDQAGIRVANLDCHCGQPTEVFENINPRILDEKA